jgi:hypothetical protein
MSGNLDQVLSNSASEEGSIAPLAEMAATAEQTKFLRRLPSTADKNTKIRATVAGGACGPGATIQFTMSEEVLTYFRDGLQRGIFARIYNVEVKWGQVKHKPSFIFTGSGANQGFIMSGTAGGTNLFASSYSFVNAFDQCQGKPLQGHEILILSHDAPQPKEVFMPFFHAPIGSKASPRFTFEAATPSSSKSYYVKRLSPSCGDDLVPSHSERWELLVEDS